MQTAQWRVVPILQRRPVQPLRQQHKQQHKQQEQAAAVSPRLAWVRVPQTIGLLLGLVQVVNARRPDPPAVLP